MRLSWWREENQFRFFLLAIVIFFVNVFAVAHIWREETICNCTSPKHVLKAEEFLSLFNDTYGPVRILPVVDRYILIEEFDRGTHTEVRLKLPKGNLTASNIDTTKWSVDKSYIPPKSYYYYIAETLFYCDAVQLTRDSRAKILILGLGGGLIDGYLHYNFPKMNITVVEISAAMMYLASKWFGLKIDENRAVVITDGVRFVEEQLKNGVEYDALILDACYSKPKNSRMCPIDALLEEKVIKTMSQVINEKGILILNSVTVSKKANDEGRFLTEKFLAFFRFCDMRLTEAGNVVFYCMHQPGSERKHVNLLEFINSIPLPSASNKAISIT